MTHTLFIPTSCRAAQFDYLGETTEGNLHLVERLKRAGVVGGILGLSSLEDIYSVDPKKLRAATQVRGYVCIKAIVGLAS